MARSDFCFHEIALAAVCVDSLETKSREAVLRGYEWSWARDNGVSDPGAHGSTMKGSDPRV